MPGFVAIHVPALVTASGCQHYIWPSLALVRSCNDFFQTPPRYLGEEVRIALQFSQDRKPRDGHAFDQLAFVRRVAEGEDSGLDE